MKVLRLLQRNLINIARVQVGYWTTKKHNLLHTNWGRIKVRSFAYDYKIQIALIESLLK